ncbi:MAG: heavy metal translocating P-type ATPase, partial [Acidobacteriaceae bacterium]|nr:heavy metal translocating P-type ATPase [Acidobacteriaceae bacterium]
PSSAIQAGDSVIVYPGEIIPVDGVIVRGRATVDQKTITGESLPLERGPGDDVFASTVIREGKLTLCASRVGGETTAAQIVQLIESAPVGETRIQNYAEQFGDRLVAPMLAVSTGLFAATANVDRLLSMLIIDFGTGIRVAAPTAVLAAIAHAAHEGILIKGGRHLERLSELDTIVFDKTGTLTHGTPEIRGVISCDERRFPARKILALAAAAEMRLKHPVSQALVAKAEAEGIEIPERVGGEFEIGLGVEARINGYHVHVGSERFFSKNMIGLGPAARAAKQVNGSGCSALLFAIDGVLKGVIPYADRVRKESRQVVKMLQRSGIKVVMITGDNGRVASAVASQLGIDRCFSDTLPSNKAEIVQTLQAGGHVVGMIGDGINDSPALAYADVGIAMKHGADVARETADVVLMEDNLWKLIAAIEIARNAMKNVRQNYAIIAGLNALALLLAIPPGLITPNVSALISNGSAVLACLNAIRPVWAD